MNALPMSPSPHKDILKFLSKLYKVKKTQQFQRLLTLSTMISSCILQQSSHLEALSSGFSNDTDRESKVKKVKRFLDSKWNDYHDYYLPFAEGFLRNIAHQKELVYIIDGTQSAGNCITLMLSVLWKGYAIPIIWLIREGEKGHFSEEKHLELLEKATEIIPKNTRNIFLGDGEFDGKKLRKKLQTLNIEYVVRTSKDRLITNECGETDRFENQTNGFENGQYWLGYASENSHAVYWKTKKYTDPVYLLTNLELAALACAYYKKRFKIELLFKQLKSAGFNLQRSKLRGEKRCSNLIMILSFAFVFCFCLGIFLKKKKKEMIGKFYRFDRIDTVKPLTLAQKCITNSFHIAMHFFHKLSNSFYKIFVYG